MGDCLQRWLATILPLPFSHATPPVKSGIHLHSPRAGLGNCFGQWNGAEVSNTVPALDLTLKTPESFLFPSLRCQWPCYKEIQAIGLGREALKDETPWEERGHLEENVGAWLIVCNRDLDM